MGLERERLSPSYPFTSSADDRHEAGTACFKDAHLQRASPDAVQEEKSFRAVYLWLVVLACQRNKAASDHSGGEEASKVPSQDAWRSR